MEELAQLAQMSQDDLFESLGKHLTTRQAFPLTKPQQVERGKQWFTAKLATLRAAICPKLPQILAKDSDEKTLILSVGDIVATAAIGVPPLVVSALIIKIGVKTLCQGTDVQPQK